MDRRLFQDWRFLLPCVLILAGLVHLALPFYFTMTGLVLCALGAGGLAALWLHKTGRGRWRDRLLAAMACCCIGLTLCMSLVMGGGQSDWDSAAQADYAIVLGCQVKSDNTPSRALDARIRKAAELLEKNDRVILIVSGGRGSDENISEAQCMYNELTAQNPAWAERIVLEDQSSTTRENFENSLVLLRKLGWTDQPVTVVTSEYHMARANYIAETLGLEITPLSGGSELIFRINYYLREVFAFVKAFAVRA